MIISYNNISHHRNDKKEVLSYVLVVIDGVWISEQIYWSLTGRSYK
jgi:hypothetical protein